MFSVYRSNLLGSAIFALAFLLWACDTDCLCFCIVISFLLETVRAKHCFARSLCCIDSWLTIKPSALKQCLQCIIIVNNAISFITYVCDCWNCIFFLHIVLLLCAFLSFNILWHDEISLLHAFLNGELCHLCSGVSSVPLPMCLYVSSLLSSLRNCVMWETCGPGVYVYVPIPSKTSKALIGGHADAQSLRISWSLQQFNVCMPNTLLVLRCLNSSMPQKWQDVKSWTLFYA